MPASISTARGPVRSVFTKIANFGSTGMFKIESILVGLRVAAIVPSEPSGRAQGVSNSDFASSVMDFSVH